MRKRLWLGTGEAAAAAVVRRMRTLVVGAIALLTLTLTSLGLAVASPSAGGNGPSDAAAPAASAASGRCSEAAAREVVRQHRLGEPSLGYAVARVLCGAFTGPGSQTMVVTLAGPTGPLDWVVFRWAGRTWQLLMRQGAGASITAAGSDIRQTVSILREGDSRCCPTGGTKTRIWHWQGTRFTASAWKQATPGTGTDPAGQIGHFKSPSGNIVCEYFLDWETRNGGRQALIICGIRTGLKPKPAYTPQCAAAGLDHNADRINLLATGRAVPVVCSGDAGPFIGERDARVLGYGKTWSGGGLRCTSAVTGLTCRNKSGRGFFLSRERWRKF